MRRWRYGSQTAASTTPLPSLPPAAPCLLASLGAIAHKMARGEEVDQRLSALERCAEVQEGRLDRIQRLVDDLRQPSTLALQGSASLEFRGRGGDRGGRGVGLPSSKAWRRGSRAKSRPTSRRRG